MIRPAWAIVTVVLLAGLSGCRWLRASDACPCPTDPPPQSDGTAPERDPVDTLPQIPTKNSSFDFSVPPFGTLPGGTNRNEKPGPRPPSILQPPLPDASSLEPPNPPPFEPGPMPGEPVVAAKPPSLTPEPLVEALRCILEDRANEALEHLKGYDPATQELFLRLLPPMALLSHKKLDQLTPPEVASLHEQLESLVVALRPRAELAIGKMCFCEWIRSYGVYKPIEENHAFQAGTPGQPGELVQLYVELHNFRSERRDAYHETRLASSVELFDQNGEKVWSYRFDDRKQPLRSLSPLHDFFNNYSFHLPRDVRPGQYTLTVQVVDETIPEQPRSAKKSLSMTVRAP
jgi:hypothetical protein